MQGAYFSLSTQPEPSSIGWSYVLKVKALLLSATLWATRAVRDFGMEIAHLRVFLHIESVIHISADAEPHLVYCDHPVSGRALEDMGLYNVVFAGGYDPELA